MINKEYSLPSLVTSEWLRESLKKGPSLTLSKLVADREDWHQFSFRTFADSGLPEDYLVNFQKGGKLHSSSEADSWLFDTLKDVMLGGMLLVEDWRANSASPFIREMTLPALFINDEVYFILRQSDPRSRPNWRRIFSNSVPTFFAFVFKDDLALREGQRIELDILRQQVSHLKMVISGVYDGESYVLAAPPQ